MSALKTMIETETKLFIREPMGMFWGLLFPAVLLLALGFVLPGARESSPDLGGARLVDLYTPTVLGLAIITLGISTLPTILSSYRERGVLRRLATTPAHPSRLVMSQLAVHVGMAVASTLLAVGVALFVFDVPLPANLFGFVLVFLVGTAGLFGIGLLIGAVAPTASAGQGIGMAVYFPLLFFAGVYFPREVMPDSLVRITDLTPSGALVRGFADTWGGGAPTVSSLVVMATSALLCWMAAVYLFRWE